MTVNFPRIYADGKKGMLFIDPSSSHMAWLLVEMDLGKKEMYLCSAGMLWTKDAWTKSKRYKYMYKAAQLLVQGDGEIIPNTLVTEAFFMNPKLPSGAAVVPTINAFLGMAAEDYNVHYTEIGPTAWRSILGIKAVKVGGKRDYKKPTADLVKQFVAVPDKIQSNINRKDRLMPHDITDVLAIAIAVAKHHGITKVQQSNTLFMPFTLIEKLHKLAEEI